MANYFHTILDRTSRKIILEEAVARLSSITFDTIVCRGRSGLAFAAPLAFLLDKELVVLNKMGSSHDMGKLAVAPDANVKNFIVVDDFMASGETINICLTVMLETYPKAKRVGVYLYRHYNSTSSIDCKGTKLRLLSRNPKMANLHIVDGYRDRD